jgi:hypothetical protein
MKTRSIGAIALNLALGTSALAANFTAGNLVVYRVGDGSNALSKDGNLVSLDEYTTNGTLVQQVMMPTNSFGGKSPLIASGTAISEGEITRSTDGRFIVLTGYGATLGQITGFSLQSQFATKGTGVPRVVGLVDGFGNIDTTTTQTNSLSDKESIRSAASTDGTNLWLCGASGGIRYTTRGSALATQISPSITNIRQLNISNNQLCFSTAAGARGIYTVTPGLPTTGGSSYQVLPNLQSAGSSPYGFVLLSLPGGPAGFNTLYFADDGGSGGIYKWSLSGGVWVSNGVVAVAGARGLTGNADGNVHLYIVSSPLIGSGHLYGYTDTTGWNAAPVGNGGNISSVADFTVTVPANEAYRGVAFAPVGGESSSLMGPAQISVGPPTDFFSTGLRGGPFPFTKSYSVANLSTSAVSWSATCDTNWVTLSPATGSLTSGASATVTASFSTAANSLLAGTNTATITFSNTTSAVGTTTRPVKLIVSDQTLAPSSGFNSSGPSNGPFAPLTQVYTLSNGVASGSSSWRVSKSATWLAVSATNGTLLAGAATNISFSIDTNNASALALGSYSDATSFSNITAGTLIGNRPADLNVGLIYFFDDFSAYNAGNLVGQLGWTRVRGTVTLPLQVSGGQVQIPAGQTTHNQDAYKNFPITSNAAVYAGMTLTVSNAPSGPASYFAALYGTTNAGGFAGYRLSASNVTASTFAFAAAVTGQGSNPSVAGPGGLTYGATYRVIVATDPVGNNMTIYVNPTSGNPASQTPYMVRNIAGGTPPLSAGAFVLSQYARGAIANVGVAIGKVAVSTNYTDVYNFLTPPPSGTINDWTSSGDGSWTNASNWSQGVPNSTQALVQVTNSVSKTVTYAVTSVQTINNLLVSAPAGLTNTLSVTALSPAARGLTILDSLTISSGGALLWNGSLVSGRELTVSGGGITVDGNLTLALGKVVATNVGTTVTIGKALFGSGQMTMSNGNFLAYAVLVPDPGVIGNTSTLNLLGGAMSSTYLVAGGGNNTGIVSITGGALVATNIAVGNTGTLNDGTGFGQMTITNADVTATSVLLGSSVGGHGVMTIKPGGTLHIPPAPGGCTACGFSINEGILDGGAIDSPGADMFAGRIHDGEMIVNSGIATFRNAYVGFDSTGTLTMPGGSMTVLNNMVVGDCGASVTGVVTISGGNLFVTNAAGNAVLDIRDHSVTLNAGLLKVDKFVMTNSCASFIHTGGTLMYGSAVLDPTRDDDGDGMPNGFEQAYGLDPLNAADANRDPDGDGLSNLQESMAGFNPTNSAAYLHVISIATTGSDVKVTYLGANGDSTYTPGITSRTNVLEFTKGTASGSYSNNFTSTGQTNILSGGTGLGVVTNMLDSGGATNIPARYYRLRVLVP